MLVALGIVIALPIGILLGGFASAALTRHRYTRDHASFRCNARRESGHVPGLSRHYRLGWQRGTWVHDALIIQRGHFPLRIETFAVQSASDTAVEPGERVSVRFHLDDGAKIRVMADASAITALVGPFLMAELDHVSKPKSQPKSKPKPKSSH